MKTRMSRKTVVLFLITSLPAIVLTVAGQTLGGEIEFTYVPPFENYDDLQGAVSGVEPDDYKVTVYINVSGWWTKPYSGQPLTTINSDGSWSCDITTGGIDQCATEIIAFLVPNGYSPPAGSGQQCLALELYDHPYAKAVRYEKLSFSGYDWWIKRSCIRVGPGPNYFEDNAWVDSAGSLHLKIDRRGNDWYCSEVIADESFGYGKYVFTVRGRADLLDENIVLGLFTWEDCVAEYNYREIDVELSKWGNPSNDNAQFVVQPWDTPGNLFRFDVDLSDSIDQLTTHEFTWQPDSVQFRSYHGEFSPAPPAEKIIASWNYTGDDVPPAGNENPRINFWLMNGNAPNNGQNAEIVIERFQHLTSFTLNADIEISPETLSLTSKSKWVTCYIRPVGGWSIGDIESSSILLENEIEPDSLRSNSKKQVATAKFSRQEVLAMLIKKGLTGNVDLAITGALNSGTEFEGTDTIKVVNSKGK
jgi:hypothetical protein